MHIPVLLREVIEILDLHPGQFVIDGTLGSGGHAREIIKQIAGGKFLGIDRDNEAIKKLNDSLKSKEAEIILVHDDYTNLPKILKEKKMDKADRLLLDLGFSSEQLLGGKGFSFLEPDEPLVMTYSDEKQPLYEVLQNLSSEELEKIIRDFSDERYADKIAKAIFEREKREPIKKVGQLLEVIKDAVPKNYEGGRINPATRTFMALRIYVNDELRNLEKLLTSLPRVMKSKGRVAIISYHSKEDKLIKEYFKKLKESNEADILTKHVVKPKWAEIKSNPRSRSAKLRTIQMK